jgi:Uma2 family endonuclease
MSTALEHDTAALTETMADLVQRLGDISLERIRLHPAPGTATEEDLLQTGDIPCELVDGTIVEKAVGYFEGRLASILSFYIESWLTANPIGYCNGESAYTRLEFGLVRVPDLSFVRWDRVGDESVPRDPICGISPNLAVEVISRKYTAAEIQRKRGEYFKSKVELVWIVNPRSRSVEVWSSPRDCRILDEADSLDGAMVLPGFKLSIAQWFQRAEGPKKPPSASEKSRKKPKGR